MDWDKEKKRALPLVKKVGSLSPERIRKVLDDDFYYDDWEEEELARLRDILSKELLDTVRQGVIDTSHLQGRQARARLGQDGPAAAQPNQAEPTVREFPGDVSAPYRFVQLNAALLRGETRPEIDLPLRDGLSARIEVEWIAESPLLAGMEGKEKAEDETVVEPFVLPSRTAADPVRQDGMRYVIPGSTLRGMVRAATEIIAQARLTLPDPERRYGLRDFDHPKYAEHLTQVDHMKAGWLTVVEGDPEEDENAKWMLRPIKTWSRLKIRYGGVFIPYTRDKWVIRPLEKKYTGMTMSETRSKNDDPYIFDFTEKQARTFSSPPGGKSGEIVTFGSESSGIVVCSDAVTSATMKKDHEYVFHIDDEEHEAMELDADVVRLFKKMNSTPSKNKAVPEGTYAKLLPTLRAGRRVPVFYVGDPNPSSEDPSFFFGFTRLFKMPHAATVGQVLAEGNPGHKPPPPPSKDVPYQGDFVENLFGYVEEPDGADRDRLPPGHGARKGRVAFSHAKLDPDVATAEKTDVIETVQMTPKASFAPFYLASPGELDYSVPRGQGASPVRIAGRKRYLPRFGAQATDQNPTTVVTTNAAQTATRLRATLKHEGKPDNPRLYSHLRFLVPREPGQTLTFRSTIRLHNVTPAELGALLFALTHGGVVEKPYRHMVGRGKPFGAGQLRVGQVRLVVTPNVKPSVWCQEPDNDEWISEGGRRGFCPRPEDGRESHSHRPFLRAFVEQMRGTEGFEAFPDLPSIREFFGACDPSLTAQIGNCHLKYMDLDQFKPIRDAFKAHKKDRPAQVKPILGGAPHEPAPPRLLPAPSAQTIAWPENGWKMKKGSVETP
jgi:CRISPR-associated protein (TIGR03986 family)